MEKRRLTIMREETPRLGGLQTHNIITMYNNETREARDEANVITLQII